MQGGCLHSSSKNGPRDRPAAKVPILRFEKEDPEETKRIEELKRQQRERQKALDQQRKEREPSPPPGPSRDGPPTPRP
jgi:hypothetical protein